MNWFTDLFKSKKKLRAEREAEFNKQIERQRLVDRASAAAARSSTEPSRSSFSNDSAHIPYLPVHAMMVPTYHSSSSYDSGSSSSYSSDSSSSDSGSSDSGSCSSGD